MDRIAPGTLLAGRYRLQEQVQADPVTALWRAEDLTLERSVGVRVLSATHARVQSTLDAARRAALVDDARLQRVLGVGVEAGSGYVVLEWVTGQDAGSLAGKVSEAEAVRIVTQAAEALRTAATRQLHHGRIGPRQVVRASDGTVRVVGTGIEVAAVGQPTPAAAARPEHRDVRDLSAVLYALATGMWPFGFAEGLLAAPTDKGRPVPARQLRDDLGEPLDRLLAETLGGTGPDTLDALVKRLHAVQAELEAAARPEAVPAGAGQGQGQDPAPDDREPDDTDVITPVPAAGARAAAGTGAAATTGAAAGAPTAGGGAAAAAVAGAAGAAAAAGLASRAASSGRPGAPSTPTGDDASPVTRTTTQRPTTQEPVTTPEESPVAVDLTAGDRETAAQGSRPGGRLLPERTPRRGVAAGGALGFGAAAPAAQQGGAPAWSPPAEDDGWDLLPIGDDEYEEQAWADGPQPWDEQSPWDTVQPWDTDETQDDADWEEVSGTGSVLPAAAPKAPRRRPAGAGTGVAVVLVMGAFVVGGLVWALDRVRDGQEAVAAPTIEVTETVAAPEPSAEAEPSVPPEPVDDAPQPISPAGVLALDPQGDGEENDADAPRAIDGDPASAWQTQAYRSQAFGGLKTGLGLAFDLGSPRDVVSLTVNAPGDGGTYEIRTNGAPGFDGSTVIATGQTGGAPVELAPETAVSTQFLILWFTALPNNGGDWRGAVSEVQVLVQ